MGIGLKDIIKDDKESLIADKQKRTIRKLLIAIAVLAIMITIVIGLIISNSIETKRAQRVNMISKDVANISNVVKGIGQLYISNNYEQELLGTSLDNFPRTLNVNGKSVEYRYDYYYLTAEEVESLISSLNVKGEAYIVNYMNGDVVNINGVKNVDGKVYHSLEDIVAIANGNSPKNIIYIHNASEMKLIQTYPNANFYLSGNIDMSEYSSGEGWEPVARFTGTFDGRSYTITNLNINRPTTMYSGLFGQVTSEAQIKDVKFKQTNVRGGNYTGILAGFCSGNISNVKIEDGQVNSQAEFIGSLVGAYDKGTISECSANNVAINGNSSVGGLVGTMYSGKIQKSSANTQLVGINSVGGLVGEIRSNAETSIEQSFANCSITGQNNVGGLLGNIEIISASKFKINDCYSEGVINGGKDNVGGSIGNIYAVNNAGIDIQSVYTATDTPTSATLRGGFIGKTAIEEGTSVQVIKCCFEKDPLLDLNVQDIGAKVGYSIVVDAKTPSEMKSRVTYSDWNFDLWYLDENVSRPRLRWEFENYS